MPGIEMRVGREIPGMSERTGIPGTEIPVGIEMTVGGEKRVGRGRPGMEMPAGRLMTAGMVREADSTMPTSMLESDPSVLYDL